MRCLRQHMSYYRYYGYDVIDLRNEELIPVIEKTQEHHGNTCDTAPTFIYLNFVDIASNCDQ